MTPAARVQAAAGVLDLIISGMPAEPALKKWARGARYAGSKDRAAVRDYVFSVLRQRRSSAYMGGGGDLNGAAASALQSETGRMLMLGFLRQQGADLSQFFGASPYGPAELNTAELSVRDISSAPRGVQYDCPDWLLPKFDASLGAQADDVLSALRSRASIGIRVNIRKTTVSDALNRLRADGYEVERHSISASALICHAAKGLERHELFEQGHIEFQDPGSQALCDDLPVNSGDSLLDLCAGGGGKSLAVAAQYDVQISAHDISDARLAQLPDRAKRSGVDISILKSGAVSGSFDGIILDVPCSGTGAWRRQPSAKWDLTRDRLNELCDLQFSIMNDALTYLKPGGWIAYMTCSLINDENEAQSERFLLQNPDFELLKMQKITPIGQTDGFFRSLFRHIIKVT